MNRMVNSSHAWTIAGAVLAAMGCAPPPALTGRGADTAARPVMAKSKAAGDAATGRERPSAAETVTPAKGIAQAREAETGTETEAEKAAPDEQTDATATAPLPIAGLGKALGGGLVITGSAKYRIIHFTFDDGPDLRFTPELLNALDAAGIKATFFFSASRFHQRSERSRRTVEIGREVLLRGHQVGSHSVRHARMSRMSRAEVIEQLDQSERAFEQVFGARTYLFRPPFGSSSAMVDRLLAGRGYTRVGWNIGLADWVERKPERVLHTWRKVLNRNERNDGDRGGVVLMHDTDPHVAAAFRLIIDDIRQRNCELLARGEELFDVVDDLSLFHLPRGKQPAGTEAPSVTVREAAFERRQAELRETVSQRCSKPRTVRRSRPRVREPRSSRPGAAPLP